jgi:transcriptional regulator with GAF, ATPase, and Fis domain
VGPKSQEGTLTESDERPSQPGWREPAAHLVRVLDCDRPLAGSARHALGGVERVLIGRGDGAIERGAELHLTIADRWASTSHALLRRALGRWIVEDAGARNGLVVNGKRVAVATLADRDVIQVGHTLFLFRARLAAPEDQPLDHVVIADAAGRATLCPSLERTLRALERVAPSTVSVLLAGETGTGKEIQARALHTRSGRGGPFVAVNCGAVPRTLIESELFGYKRGAFSDAREDRPGLVRSADGGTLFLDEIGDLPLAMQAPFLRVLQEREVVPVGATSPIPVDVRVCAASQPALGELVAAGRFRADLYARLNGFAVALPPLRERIEDLGLLVAALTRRLAASPASVVLRAEAALALLRHPWPHNVRELEQTLAAALALAGGAPIEAGHLPDALRAGPRRAAAATAPPAGESAADEARRAELIRLLAEHAGNISAVARAMGKQRVQIRRWLRRYGLDPAGSS